MLPRVLSSALLLPYIFVCLVFKLAITFESKPGIIICTSQDFIDSSQMHVLPCVPLSVERNEEYLSVSAVSKWLGGRCKPGNGCAHTGNDALHNAHVS